jgi:hypothetical protein
MCNKYLYIAFWLGSFALIPTGASAHHPGIGGVGGAGGITTIGAGTMEQGEFGLALFVEYTRLKQLSDATLLANIGNDVHGLQSVEKPGGGARLWCHQRFHDLDAAPFRAPHRHP